MTKKLFIFNILIFLTSVSIYPLAGKVENIPMKPYSNIIIQDGEVLRYSIEEGGENVSEFKFITILSNDITGRYANIYHDGINGLKNEKYPSVYSNYIARFLISLNTASLIEHYFGENSGRTNDPPNALKQGPVTLYKKSVYDSQNSVINIETKIRNGYRIESLKNRVAVKPGFPVLDLGSVMVMGIRFLDITGPGIAIFVVPEIIKEPLPMTFRFIGREKITTKIGVFKTIKVGFIVSDTFLSRLMQPFTKETFVWLEDSDRRLVIKMKSPNQEFILTEIGNINLKTNYTK